MSINDIHIQTIIVLVNLTLGYVVWTYNSKSYLNKILTSVILCILLIDVSLLLNLKLEEGRYLTAAVVLGSLGISFFPPLLFTLSLHYPIRTKPRGKYLSVLYGISLLLSLLIILFFPREHIIDKIVLPADIRNISLRRLPLAFIVLYFLLTAYSILLLILTTRHFLASMKGSIIPYEKNSVRMLLIFGLPLAYLVSLVSVMNYFFLIPFPWISILLAAFTLFIVLLVFRFHLADLKRLISGILFYPALISILVLIYMVFVVKNQEKIAGALNLPVSVTLVLEVFIIYMAVSTLRRVTSFSFIMRKFPAVQSFRRSDLQPVEYLSYARTLGSLSSRLQNVLGKYVHNEQTLLLVLDRDCEAFVRADGGKVPVLGTGSPVLRVLKRLDRGITIEEILMFVNDRHDVEVLHNAGFDLILPASKGDEIVAIMLLPRRGFIQRWSEEDISALNSIRVVLPSLIDRCEMYENEKEIEKHQYRMEQLMVMGKMTSEISHEIRNPLSIISTSVETILNGGVGSDERSRMLGYIQEEADRINILVNRLLSINFGKKPELRSVEIVKILQKLKHFLKYKLKESDITLAIKNTRPLNFSSDDNILFQVLLNLVLNAIEAMESGGHIDIDYEVDGHGLSLIVSDSGPGIPEEAKERIFEPFYTTKKRGSGLGLTVTKQLVENLSGSIELLPVRSGACFRVTLPLRTRWEKKE